MTRESYSWIDRREGKQSVEDEGEPRISTSDICRRRSCGSWAKSSISTIPTSSTRLMTQGVNRSTREMLGEMLVSSESNSIYKSLTPSSVPSLRSVIPKNDEKDSCDWMTTHLNNSGSLTARQVELRTQ